MSPSSAEIVKKLVALIAPLADLVLAPFTLLGSVLLKAIRTAGVARMPVSKKIFERVGVFPVRDHYYEPMFNHASLGRSLRKDRHLPGVDLNVRGQLGVLDRFVFNQELERFPLRRGTGTGFYYHNGYFESGDAEYFYNMIRLYKPSMLVEIGSGFSTLIAREAIRKNSEADQGYRCEHVCVEPYENKWLDGLGAEVIREPVQNVNRELFERLGPNDILFIDSSHVIRPQGDVLFEYLGVLPSLNPGVLVHVHDVFTPKDYLDEWVLRDVLFWNEQYLLEAFLSLNGGFEVVGALNFLAHNHRAALAARCPVYAAEAERREPGSFWMMRT